MDMWKRWMLIFWYEVDGEWVRDTYYFDTKEEMRDFINNGGVRVEKMFHLMDVDWD